MVLGDKTSRSIWLLICLIMAAMTVLSGRYLWLAVACKGWPAAECVIQSAEVVEKEVKRQGRPGTRTHYAARLSYSFAVAGIEYIGERVSFGDFAGASSSSPKAAQECLARYAKGTKTSVHYNPKNPSVSVLETQLTWPNVVLPGGFALATLLCWTGFRKGWRLRTGRNWSNRT